MASRWFGLIALEPFGIHILDKFNQTPHVRDLIIIHRQVAASGAVKVATALHGYGDRLGMAIKARPNLNLNTLSGTRNIHRLSSTSISFSPTSIIQSSLHHESGHAQNTVYQTGSSAQIQPDGTVNDTSKTHFTGRDIELSLSSADESTPSKILALEIVWESPLLPSRFRHRAVRRAIAERMSSLSLYSPQRAVHSLDTARVSAH